MRNLGLARLRSISGVHITIVVACTMWLIRKTLALLPWIALRWPIKGNAAAAAATTVIAYTLMGASQVPTVRSCIATVIVLLGIAVGRDVLSLRMISAGAFFIILVRPEALLGPSFQMSFAAVTGLVSLYQSRFARWLARALPASGRAFRALHHGIALLATGIIAEAMLSTTALFHFNQSGVYGVLANFVAIPLTEFVVMPRLMLSLLLDVIGLAAPVYWLLGKSMDLRVFIAAQVSSWPASLCKLPLIAPLGYGLLVIGGLWVCLWQGRWRSLGVFPAALGVVLSLSAPPPDLLISADGRQLALLLGTGEVGAGRLAMLRERDGSYIRDMWRNAAAAPADAALADLPCADASQGACVADIAGRGRGYHWRRLATLSKDLVARADFASACAAADIVVSNRKMPAWCVPR